jgi:flagellar hook assembly protein FlgD
MADSTIYATSSISADDVSAYTSSTSETSESSLLMEDFFSIIAAELSNQDPLSSDGNNTDYVTQMAQFAMLSSMEELKESIEALGEQSQLNYDINTITSGSNMIGKEVTITTIDEETLAEEEITGTVEKVKFYSDGMTVVVDGVEYSTWSVTELSD